MHMRKLALAAVSSAALACFATPAAAATIISGTTNGLGVFTYHFSFDGGPLEIRANSGGTRPIGDPYLYLFADNGSPDWLLTGNLIGRNDDSFGTLNSFLGFADLAAGNYIARVGKWPLSILEARTGVDVTGCRHCTLSLEFTGGAVPTGAVPEPATWAMMLLGFAAVGAALRNRKRQQPRVSYAF